jgi:hypothetical protein
MMAKTNTGRAIRSRTLMLTQLGVLTAIVVALQILAIVMRPLFPAFTISLVLLPIAIGAALIGTMAGGWLGLAFGAAVLISGDAAPFMAVNIPATVFVVLFKGMCAGFAAGLVYKLLAKKSRTAGAIAAAVVCPIVNTGIFIIGAYLFFLPTITTWTPLGQSTTAFIFLGMVGVNFLVELGLNIVFIPVIVRLIQYGQDRKSQNA